MINWCIFNKLKADLENRNLWKLLTWYGMKLSYGYKIFRAFRYCIFFVWATIQLLIGSWYESVARESKRFCTQHIISLKNIINETESSSKFPRMR